MPFLNALRQPRTVVAVVLLLIVVGVAAAWLLPPLGTGNGGVASGPPGGRTETGVHGQSIIYYVAGGRVAFGMEVRNTTFLPVTIVGLHDADAGAGGFLLDGTHLLLGTDPTFLGLEDEHTRPFEPMTLGPGASRLIGVVGTFPTCADARPRWSTGVGIGIDSLLFDVRVAGLLPAGADVPLLQAVDLRGDADAACP